MLLQGKTAVGPVIRPQWFHDSGNLAASRPADLCARKVEGKRKLISRQILCSTLYAIQCLLVDLEGPVAQRLEQGTHNPLVGGSKPSGPTIHPHPQHPIDARCDGCVQLGSSASRAELELLRV